MARKGSQAWALEIAARKWGKDAGIKDRGASRDGERLPASDAERAEYRARFLALKDAEPKKPDIYEWPAEAQIGTFRAALDVWKAEYAMWKRDKDHALSWSHYRRFAIGTASRWFFEIKGEGDTWEEALCDAGALVDLRDTPVPAPVGRE